MTDYRLGCLIPMKGNDKWFAQIVEPWAPGVRGYKVAATGMGTGREETLKKVCGFVGLDEVPPIATIGDSAAPHGVVYRGLSGALRHCAHALDALATDFALLRHDLLTDGVDQYEMDI